MYAPLPHRFRHAVDVITGHVPYIPRDDVDALPSEIKDHEPIFTLTDDSGDGLGLLRRAIAESVDWVKPGGWLLLELSDDIAVLARSLCRAAGYEDHGIAVDEDRLSVVVEARFPTEAARGRRRRRQTSR